MRPRGGTTTVKLLIFGTTGGTGRALVEQALEQGHEVTAFARDPTKVRTTHKNLRVAKGDILDSDSVAAAMKSQDVALSALGIKVSHHHRLPVVRRTGAALPAICMDCTSGRAGLGTAVFLAAETHSLRRHQEYCSGHARVWRQAIRL